MNTSSISKTIVVVAFALLTGTSAFAAPAAPAPAAAPPAAATAKAPAATILFLDRAAVLRQSSVGKDMAAQVDAMIKKMEAEFAPEGKKLQTDTQALQGQIQVLSAEVRQQKIKDIEARRAALQKKIQDRQASIQAGLAQARQKVEQSLGPVLEALLKERGANLLLDRGLVVLGQTDLDITTVVITRLNTALPKVAVTLAAPRPAAAAAAGQPKPAAAGH